MKDPRRTSPPRIDDPADRGATPDPLTVRDAAVDPHLGGGLPLAPRRPFDPSAVEGEFPPVGLDGGDPVDRIEDDEPPALRPAVLGRLEGSGLVVVVRDAQGTVVAADGTWQPADTSASLDELRRTFPEGSATRFAGSLVDGRAIREVALDVVIERHGDYTYEDGTPFRVVNFAPRSAA
jgi:hypothetical protein